MRYNQRLRFFFWSFRRAGEEKLMLPLGNSFLQRNHVDPTFKFEIKFFKLYKSNDTTETEK